MKNLIITGILFCCGQLQNKIISMLDKQLIRKSVQSIRLDIKTLQP